MTARHRNLVLAFLLAALALLSASSAAIAADAVAPTSEGAPSLHRDVGPILRTKCQGCHQPARAGGKVVLSSYEDLVREPANDDPLVVPGTPDESRLLDVLVASGGRPARMPKDAPPLSEAEVAAIRRWIEAGAADDTPASARVVVDPDHPPVYAKPPVIASLDLSPDGRLLAVSGHHEVALHELRTGADGAPETAPAGRLVGLAERIESVSFSPDGTLLAVGGGSPAQAGEVQVWDVEGRKLRLSLPVTFDTIRGVRWSPDGRLISFGCADNSVRAIEATSGKQVLYQGAHDDWVLDTVFSVDGSHLVSVSRDMSMKLIQVATQQFLDNITSITPGALRGGLMAVDRHPTKDELLVGGSDGIPRFYKMHRTQARQIGDDFNLLKALDPVPGRIFAARFRRDGERLVVGSGLDGAGEVRVHGTADGKLLWRVGVPGAVYASAFSPDGKLVVAGGFDGLVRLLDSESGKTLRELVPVPISADAPKAAGGELASAASPVSPGAAASQGAAAPASAAPAADLRGPTPVRLEVFPEAIDLAGRFAYRQLLVTGVLESGERIDLTRAASVEGCGGVVTVSPSRLVRAAAEGSGELRISAAGLEAKVPVAVGGLAADAPVSYVSDVLPVLARLGCNSGTCHGSAKGKNGFKLSLRGYDPLEDWRALTDDLAARRFNRAAPERSLFLLKPTGGVPHGGGVLLQPGEPYYEILRSWVAGGARADLDTPRVASIEVFPKDPVLPLPGSTVQVAVVARTADGSARDVTAEAFLESSSTETLQVDRESLVTGARRGGAALLARYEGRYAASSVFVMGDRSGFEWRDPPRQNWIDEVVDGYLRRIRAVPSGLCTDAEFVRRVWLDLTGIPPSPADVGVFLADTRDSRVKRDELIDRLIGSADFVEHWTNKWCDLLQVNRKFLGEEGARALREWVRGAIASNMPYDGFARSLLGSSGSTVKNPPAAYWKVLRKPEDAMESTTQLFLGVRFNCNKCHDHPFERWTQKEYWQLAAFFSRVKRENAPGSPIMPIRGDNQPEDAPPAFEELISDAAEGGVVPPTGGKPVLASFPFRHDGIGPEDRTYRDRLTEWLVSPSNPYFARSYANRIWSYFIGKGLIDPADDIRAGNPPAIPELLDRLTEEFVRSGFDVRQLMRTILRSRVYQQSIETNAWNEDEDGGFSHALARRLPAEALWDAIHRAVGVPGRLPGMRPGERAAAALDASVKAEDGFLDLFGRPPRESACECERSSGMSLGQSLSLVNGPTVAEAIQDPRNGIASLVRVEKAPARILRELFISVLCRPPTPEEEATLGRELDPSEPAAAEALDPQSAAELAARKDAWETAQSPAVWTTLEPGILRAAGGATLARRDDASVLASGTVPEKDTYTIVLSTELARITGLRLEVLPDDSLPAKGPGRAENGNLVLGEIRVSAAPAAHAAPPRQVEFAVATADVSQQGYDVSAAIDGKPETGWAILPAAGARHVAVFEAKEDFGWPGGTIITVTLDQSFGGKHTIGRLRLSATGSPRPVRFSALPEDLLAALAVEREKRSPEQAAAIHRHYMARDPDMAERIRLQAAQDLAWALINSPAFLFNR